MHKKYYGVLAAALLLSIGIAACGTDGQKTPSASQPITEMTSSPSQRYSSSPESTQTGSAPSSTTRALTTAGISKAPPNAPKVPQKQESTSSSMEEFTSLSQLKALARRHTNAASGFAMMREGILILPKAGFLPQTPSDRDYQGSFSDQVLNFGFSTSLGGKPLDVTYSVLQKAYPSRDIRECIKSSVINRCIPVSIGGTTYYYDAGSMDGRDIVSVYYFYENYCVTAVFYDPPMKGDGSFSVAEMESHGFFTMSKKSLS